jgi:hypothetical protein
MKFIGLDGKEYHVDTRQSKFPLRSEAGCKSKIQYRCGQIIKSKFNLDPILEEFTLTGHKLTIDFFIPTHKIAFEVDGSQHEDYNTFFYKNKREFLNAQKRDDDKQQICDINGWTLIRVQSEEELCEILNVNSKESRNTHG